MDPLILAQLGALVIKWARVEALCGELLERMLRATPGILHVIVPTVSNASLVGWMRVLAPDRLSRPEFREEVLELLTEVDHLRADRNSLVHGVWRPGEVEGTAMVQTVRFDRPDIITDRLVTRADLHELEVDIGALGDRLFQVAGAIRPF